MIKSIALLLYFFFISLRLLYAENAPAAKPHAVNLEDLAQFAKENNPEIMSSKAEWLAARKKIWIESSLPDPEAEIAAGSQENRYSVMQTVPFIAKLFIRGKIASKEAESAHFRYRIIERDIRLKIAETYYDLYFMLRHPLLSKKIDKSKLKIVQKNLSSEQINFKAELAILLPTSHHLILKNFKETLKRELEKYM